MLSICSWQADQCWVQRYKQVYFFKSGDILLHCFPLFFSKLWKICFSNFKPHWDTRRSATQIQEKDTEQGVEGRRRRIVSKAVKKAGGFFSEQWKSFVLGRMNNVKQCETKHVSSRVPKESLRILKNTCFILKGTLWDTALWEWLKKLKA